MRDLFLAFLTFFSISSTVNAVVLTVSNDINSPGQYTDVTTAMSAASNGDTVYVHGTNLNYGSFTIDKQLTIIGSGHRPQNQNANVSIADIISMDAGSSGSKIIGFKLQQVKGVASSSNVLVARNMVTDKVWTSSANVINWIVEGNVFTNTATCLDLQNQSSNTGWQIINNVINGQSIQMLAAYSYFYNNVFLRDGAAFNTNVSNAYFYNNVFYRAYPQSHGSNCIFEKNISYQCSNNAFVNGVNFENQDPMFVNFPNGGDYFDYPYNFDLQGGSPGENAGTDGTDIGVYGGTSGRYDHNGVPNIPQVREFNAVSGLNVAPGGTININVKSTVKP